MVGKHFFATSRNNITVVFDPIHSHAATHLADTPQIRPLVEAIIQATNLEGDTIKFDTDTGTVIGNSDLVETDETDEIVYAMRTNRDSLLRFTKSRAPQPSSMVTVILLKIDDTTYELYSAWLGPLTPATPNSPYADATSFEFWSNHALVWGGQEIQPGTETPICPW